MNGIVMTASDVDSDALYWRLLSGPKKGIERMRGKQGAELL